MAQCIACGLRVNGAGKLEVQLRPGGGIECDNSGDGNDGLFVTPIPDNGALAAAAAAQTTANAAYAGLTAANAGVNTALDRVPNKVRWGFHTGTTNVAGDTDFAHNLGGVPASVVCQPHASSGSHVWTCVVEALDGSNVNVRIHNTTTGAAMASQAVGFSWFAAL